MNKTLVIGCLFTVFLMLMIPVKPAVEYNQIEETFINESKETTNSIIYKILSFYTAKREYTRAIEEQIQKIDSKDCDCNEDDNKEPSIYIPIVCEIVQVIVYIVCISLGLLAIICKALGNRALANDLIDLELEIVSKVIPIFC